MVYQAIQVRTYLMTSVIDVLSIKGPNGLAGQIGFQGQKGERGNAL